MLSIPINIKEEHGISRKAEPVTIGIPFKKGDMHNSETLSLYHLGNEIPCQITTTAHWHDASIKWILLKFQLDLAADTEKKLSLIVKQVNDQNLINHSIKQAARIVIEETEHDFTINTGNTLFVLNKKELKPFEQIIQNETLLLDSHQNSIVMEDKEGNRLKPLIKTAQLQHGENNISSTINLKGTFLMEEGSTQDSRDFALFSTDLTFYAGKATVKWDFTLHNPKPAQHKGGIWDLGDEGSIYFSKLSARLITDSALTLNWKEQPDSQWKQTQASQFILFQDSSGGENWKSQNHINSRGKVPIKFKGYQCIENDKLIQNGDRASPFIYIRANKFHCSAYIKQFWQNFPKAITIKDNCINLSLFPELFNDCFELQAGEKKTHSLYFDFSEDKEALAYCPFPLLPRLSAAYYAQTEVFLLLPGRYERTALDELIQAGIEGDNNFFEKREIIDEYGWRNFGDLFADHESLYKNDKQINISHYNNQYDPIYGFARQFALSGDQKYFALMSDLAQHVVDIDIYHTDDDRHEYNGGLFWHTSHYVDVATSTHRSYSQAHIEDDPHTGGGPGDEHCYATGLSVHYFMTGSEQSKQAVLTLAEWMIKVHEGNGGFFERLLRFKQIDLPILKQVSKGESIVKYKYPFHRGIGNYISVLLDAYNVTSDSAYISKVEKIIRSTIHPGDDISSRHLEDIEAVDAPATWSYTVLLQAIIKYLMIKISMDEIDSEFYYARDSLIHYTDWMLENEYPYLEKPEVLEFPNHTWVAQDLRKAYILSIASAFNKKHKDLYLQKADYFFSYVINNLKNNKTCTFTRIIVLLMQNHIDIKQMDSFQWPDDKLYSDKSNSNYKKHSTYTVKGILYQFAAELGESLLNLSIKREMKWLKLRL